MGMYNRLSIENECRHCGVATTRVVQFKFGECQIHDYELGDSINWAAGRSARSNVGSPVAGRGWVPAYAEEPCPSCATEFGLAEFAVVLDGDRLAAIEQAPVGYHFPEHEDVFALCSDASLPTPVRDL